MAVTLQDHVAAALALLLEQFRRPGIEALTTGLVTPMDDIEADAFDVMANRINIDTAEGAQLDLIGELLKVTRPTGMSDADFRLVLRREILLHASHGTTDDIINIALDVVSGWGVRTIEGANAEAEFEAQARRTSDGAVMPYDPISGGPGWTQEEFDAVLGYLNRARAAGVYFVLLARQEPVVVEWDVAVSSGDAPTATGTFTFSGTTYDVMLWQGVKTATVQVASVGPGNVLVGCVGRGGSGGNTDAGGGGSAGAVFGELLVPHSIGNEWLVQVDGDGDASFLHSIIDPADQARAYKGGNGGDGGNAGEDPLGVTSLVGILGGTVVSLDAASGGGGAGALGGTGGGTAGGDGAAGLGGGGGGSTAAGQAAAAGGDGGAGTDLSASIYGAMLAAVSLGTTICGGGGGGGHSPAADGGIPGSGGDGGADPSGSGNPGTAPGSGGGGSAGPTPSLTAGFPGIVILAIPQGSGAPATPHVPFAFDGAGGATFDGVTVASPVGGSFQIMSSGARGQTPE